MIKRSSPTKTSISQTTARSKHKHSINYTSTKSRGNDPAQKVASRVAQRGKRREESIELKAWPALQIYADSIATEPSKGRLPRDESPYKGKKYN